MRGRRRSAVPLTERRAFARAATLTVGGASQPSRVRLLSDRAASWQVHTSTDNRVTFCDPSLANAGNLYPTAWGFVRPGANEVKLRLEAVGEGFHSATACDEDGNPIAAVRHFIDLDDLRRYELELTAPVGLGRRLFGLELHEVKVLAADGVGPYWADDLRALFDPERRGR